MPSAPVTNGKGVRASTTALAARGRRRVPRALAITGAVVAPLAGAIGYSRFGVDHAAPLPPPIDAERESLISPVAGEIAYYRDTSGSGRPLVLVHSVNAGASSYEMRPLFDYFRGSRPVVALDLPGFGFSERSDRVYSPEVFTAALADLLTALGVAEQGGADVVALSLGCEFAARVAAERPALIHSLALISPSGMSRPGAENSSQRAGASSTGRALHAAFAFPLWSQAFYDALVSRPSLRYFLQRSFVGAVDPGLLDYSALTTHQPGARHAPLYFVSGLLFTPNALETLYANVKQPALVLYDQDGYVSFDALPGFVEAHDNWRAERLAPTRGLPQFERLSDTTRALRAFWSAAPVPRA